ncbi:hypothetical protein MTP10_29235 [Nonomuraea sp. 3-1Str]|uniref:hypothetical protein n=1 Tax=Nonomuraea sp. 3-1Str TaxID=2929801 RepID=UPI002857E18E|nr:hypothetical protein [Nonomuraea sp. 3-1Str]MDR8412802.1 hypothetical protein [Nonomuraea sp. 3-1Str]
MADTSVYRRLAQCLSQHLLADPPSRRDLSGDALSDLQRPFGGLRDPEEIFRRDVIDRHRLPDHASGTTKAEPDIAPSPQAVAADREWLVQMTAAAAQPRSLPVAMRLRPRSRQGPVPLAPFPDFLRRGCQD